MPARTFTIGEHDFLLDGQPHRVISGALHYFRVHPDQWRDRIRMGRMMGLNTIRFAAADELDPHRHAEGDRRRRPPLRARARELGDHSRARVRGRSGRVGAA